MLEAARKEDFPKNKKLPPQFSQKMVEDFIVSIPVMGDLYQSKDELNPTLRANSFLGMVDSLGTILDHFDKLSKKRTTSCAGTHGKSD
jgi:hypothetical protein